MTDYELMEDKPRRKGVLKYLLGFAVVALVYCGLSIFSDQNVVGLRAANGSDLMAVSTYDSCVATDELSRDNCIGVMAGDICKPFHGSCSYTSGVCSISSDSHDEPAEGVWQKDGSCKPNPHQEDVDLFSSEIAQSDSVALRAATGSDLMDVSTDDSCDITDDSSQAMCYGTLQSDGSCKPKSSSSTPCTFVSGTCRIYSANEPASGVWQKDGSCKANPHQEDVDLFSSEIAQSDSVALRAATGRDIMDVSTFQWCRITVVRTQDHCVGTMAGDICTPNSHCFIYFGECEVYFNGTQSSGRFQTDGSCRIDLTKQHHDLKSHQTNHCSISIGDGFYYSHRFNGNLIAVVDPSCVPDPPISNDLWNVSESCTLWSASDQPGPGEFQSDGSCKLKISDKDFDIHQDDIMDIRRARPYKHKPTKKKKIINKPLPAQLKWYEQHDDEDIMDVGEETNVDDGRRWEHAVLPKRGRMPQRSRDDDVMDISTDDECEILFYFDGYHQGHAAGVYSDGTCYSSVSVDYALGGDCQFSVGGGRLVDGHWDTGPSCKKSEVMAISTDVPETCPPQCQIKIHGFTNCLGGCH